MKRLAALLALAIVLSLASAAQAGVMGNPLTMVKQGTFALGIEGSWLSEMKLKDTDMSVSDKWLGVTDNWSFPIKDVKITDDANYMGTFTFGAWDWLNLFAKVGVADGGKLKFNEMYGAGDTESYEAKLKSVLIWNVGIKARAFETTGGLGLLLSAEYTRYDDRDIGTLSYNGGQNTATSSDDTIDFWRFDGSAALYYKIGGFVPYVGALYSYSESKINFDWTYADGYQQTSNFTGKVKDSVGALVGVAWDINQHFALNLQGVFITRTAVSLGVSYAF